MLYRGVIPDEPNDDDFDIRAGYFYFQDEEYIFNEDFDLELDD